MVRSNTIDVYLEIGKKRVIAGALAWPGWCRAGRDEQTALEALLAYAPRYAAVLRAAQISFDPPTATTAFNVVERLAGTATTDFGAPDIAPATDAAPINAADLHHLQTLLRASWQAFDAALDAARGKELRLGPRGGGRDRNGIAEHVLNAERSYIRRLAWTCKPRADLDIREQSVQTRQAALDTLAAAAQGKLPERGPRGGALWKPRYFVRRAAWHVLDHVWEIEDRVM